MTGARLTIEVDGLAAVRKSLGKLIAAGHDATPLMGSIGEGLLKSTRERFATETDPDGRPWAPLSRQAACRFGDGTGGDLMEVPGA